MRSRRTALVVLAAVLWVLVPAAAAQAHPLGNFTVNHYNGLTFAPGAVSLHSVVDRAEIPTAQALQEIAPDGSPDVGQLRAAAAAQCADLTRAVQLTVDREPVVWTVQDSALEPVPGAAGLPTLRLTCDLRADAALDRAATVAFGDSYLAERVGWHEITADGKGVRLIDSPVPVDSVTNELRVYPVDLLASPVEVRSFTVATEPGTNTGSGTAITPGSGDPFTNAMASMDRRLEDLIGNRGLTPLVGALAVLLALLLGCGHALLPGHGKTVMAAYLAGRRGRSRDAITVGATVTATHTVGVLVLGLAITLSSSLAGDQVLRWLGVGSGLLVAGIGLAMLRGAVPRWRAARALQVPVVEALPEPALAGAVSALMAPGHGDGVVHLPHHPHGDHDAHGHDHEHPHDHDHEHPHDHAHPQGHDHDAHDHDAHDNAHTHEDEHEHGHDHHHDHAHDAHGHDHQPEHQHEPADGSWWAGGHSHGPGSHSHGPGDHSHGPGAGRGGLIGMGVAGGLVPSPSALIVLLASIGLGRTIFGVVLVLAYGAGMAGTLTAVGLLLVRIRGRLERRAADLRRARLLARVARVAPVVTAALVLFVGLALVVRGTVLGV